MIGCSKTRERKVIMDEAMESKGGRRKVKSGKWKKGGGIIWLEV
jgi:hypothetical protein